MTSDCTTCVHYRRPKRRLSRVLPIFGESQDPEVGQAQVDNLKREEQSRFQEEELLREIYHAGSQNWPEPPSFRGHCASKAGVVGVCEIKNQPKECPEYRTGRATPKSCHTCIYRHQPSGTIDASRRVTDMVHQIDLVGTSGDFVLKQTEQILAANAKQKAVEAQLAIYGGSGPMRNKPAHLAWCEKRSHPGNYFVCEMVNRADDCEFWFPRPMLGIVGLGGIVSRGFESITQLISTVTNWFRARGDSSNINLDTLKQRATSTNDPDLLYAIGWLYETGELLSIDGAKQQIKVAVEKKSAFEWFQRAAEAGHQHAQFLAGQLHFDGQRGDRQLREAARLFESAAKQGHPEAAIKLATMFRAGIGVDANMTLAETYLHMALDLGSIEAGYELGNHYIINAKDHEQEQMGIRMIVWSAENGNCDAQFLYGSLLRHGRGVPSNSNEARKWLGEAAAQGHDLSRRMLQSMDHDK